MQNIDDLKALKTCKCKWCNIETLNIYSRECDRCWELRHRIENNIELAEKILNELKFEKMIINLI